MKERKKKLIHLMSTEFLINEMKWNFLKLNWIFVFLYEEIASVFWNRDPYDKTKCKNTNQNQMKNSNKHISVCACIHKPEPESYLHTHTASNPKQIACKIASTSPPWLRPNPRPTAELTRTKLQLSLAAVTLDRVAKAVAS